MPEPTQAELQAAYHHTRLWMQGMSLARAMTEPLIRACLRGIAINQRRQAERDGNRAPDQPALI